MKLGIIVIEITNNCNLKCRYCSLGKTNGSDMDIKKCEHIFNVIAKYNPETVVLSGGEPLMHHHFMEILTLAAAIFGNVGITTNGTLVTKRHIDLFKSLLNVSVQISIDGTEKIHDMMRGSGTYKLVKQNIERLLLMGIGVHTMTVLTKENIYLIDKMVEEITTLGVSKIAFERFTAVGNGEQISNQTLGPKELKWLSRHLEENGFYNGKVFINDPIINLQKFNSNYKQRYLYLPCAGCFAGVKNFAIDIAGYVRPCTRIPIKLCEIDDFSFDNLVNNRTFQRLFIRNLNCKCNMCKDIMLCGGCRAEAYAKNGDIFGADEGCWF